MINDDVKWVAGLNDGNEHDMQFSSFYPNAVPSENKSYEYVTETTDSWQKEAVIDGKLNRLVIWPGNVWHSVEVKVPPEDGRLNEKRLTQRVIIDRL